MADVGVVALLQLLLHLADEGGVLVQQPAVLDMSLLPALSNPDVPAPALPKPASASGFTPAAGSASISDVAKAAASAGQQIYLRYLGAE